uniref:RRM domain-containing protein n=1 Tax=Rhabditophanes sp. KR3021 TaxID=114890 RepID=A0AC35U381_9BILA
MEVDPSYEDYCREQNNNNLLVVKIGELADACSPVDLMFFCHNNNVQPVCVDALGNGFGIFAFSNANYLNHFLEILRRTEFIQLGNVSQ